MEWILRSPQIHTTFSNLGYAYKDGYHINENCNAALETILHNIVTEDKCLRSYRRNISFGQNVRKDLIPLLINAKEENTVELLIKIFANLTTPIECLFNLDDISKSDFGRHTVFEINNLLAATKTALTDHRTTKVIVDFLKKNAEQVQKTKISESQCKNITNTLTFLRNILHIPDDVNSLNPNYNGPTHTIHNQILWNLFSQSIDKVLIKLMNIPDSGSWGVTMVQLIALLYKDQHVTMLHKLLNVWLESSVSESSEDNESNTSPPARGSDGHSSPMLTSDTTNDSSDTEGSIKCSDESNSAKDTWKPNRSNSKESKVEVKPVLMEHSHRTNENNTESGQESMSTSSNEDELPCKKPMLQKPHTSKQRINNKTRSSSSSTLQERKRRKIVKRAKSNIINVQGLSHNSPTDDDISKILKEFTVDFLLKGFNSLVKTLHTQVLTNRKLEIDTSHFFWLVTYFLKFATQIELDMQHVCSVLSFDIISYLTAEGVNICEQFELAIKLDGNNLKLCIRRLHLVVTAIREFAQAIEVYKKSRHLGCDDQRALAVLQMKMCETEELRSLLILLLRHYNPKYHSKQYLQDLIVTNHILLISLDSSMKLPEYKGFGNMVDHVRQFANADIIHKYGLLLEDYEANGEYVNDCVFTIMHHVGGDLDSLISLNQPKILKTFTTIWKTEFEVCDDWSDLIQYVINTYVNKPQTLHNLAYKLESECFAEKKVVPEGPKAPKPVAEVPKSISSKKNSNERWTDDEITSLSWNYMQCSTSANVIGEIIKLFQEDGTKKSKESVIRELLKQSLINKNEFDKLMKIDVDIGSKSSQTKKEKRDLEIGKLCKQIAQDGKGQFLDWLQIVILETCNVKIYLDKKSATEEAQDDSETRNHNLATLSPVSYHFLLFEQSVPLVPWNCEQAAICKDLKFLQLLHKLGFQMPVDTGKVFIRIPHFWTPDFLYEVAAKISPIDTSKLKFSLDDISESSIKFGQSSYNISVDPTKYNHIMHTPAENFYQVQEQKYFASIVNFTPMPGSSYNASSEEVNKPNWLEMVQKAKEYNFNLCTHQSMLSEHDEKIQKRMVEIAAAALPTAPDAIADMDAKDDASHESEYYNNSVCETASVASDLTRMCVSDEEE